MAFDEEPDGDPHGLCAKEIHELQAQVKAAKLQVEQLTTDVMRLTTAIGPYCTVEGSVRFATKCRQEWAEAVRLVEAWQPVVEAARELIGKNVTRPEVYQETDKGKHKLALALAGIAAKEGESKGVFCLTHRKVMIDGVCPKCGTAKA